MQWGEVVSGDDEGRKKKVSRTSMTLGAREYSQDVLPEMICNRNFGKKKKLWTAVASPLIVTLISVLCLGSISLYNHS